MHVTAIIAAGGRGTRFGGQQLKQLLSVGGRAVLERSIAAFATHPAVSEVIVALPDDMMSDPPAYLHRSAVRVVAGGPRRQDSVVNAFHAASAASDLIVIHDAARPFPSADLIARTIAAAAESGAAIAALQSRDTVKEGELMVRQADHERATAVDPLTLSASKDARAWAVKSTLPRESIFLAQTPQAFRRDVLRAALSLAAVDGGDATDEAALVERAGYGVRLVEGEATNIKITTPADVAVAEAIARSVEPSAVGSAHAEFEQSPVGERRPASAGRTAIGTGYDLHRLVDGRPLIVGGVRLDSPRGALGHSDADVACHAIVDAMLGAASLGDIGSHFPDSDPRWKDASGVELIGRAAAVVRAAGYLVANVDATVVLEAPKIRDHVEGMRRAIAAALGVDVGRVSVKGKTNEGVDAVGRGEAIAAHAVALLREAPDAGIPNPESRNSVG